jgi:hypothetical protein
LNRRLDRKFRTVNSPAAEGRGWGDSARKFPSLGFGLRGFSEQPGSFRKLPTKVLLPISKFPSKTFFCLQKQHVASKVTIRECIWRKFPTCHRGG